MNNPTKDKTLDLYFAVLVCVVVLVRGLLITQYGINREAGGEIDAIFQILDGRLIYRDFFWYHGFLPLYWNALLFKIFGAGMYVMRVNVVLFAVLGVFFAYKVSRLFNIPVMAIIVSLISFSGLVTPLHVTGQSIAISFEIISLYYLLEYLNSGDHKNLLLSGLYCGIMFLIQIFPMGAVTLAGTVLAFILYAIFDSNSHLPKLKYFLLGAIPLPVICYGLLATVVPLEELYRDLFPMFSGYEVSPGEYASFPIPPIIPGIHLGQSATEMIAVLNKYISTHLRWWLIVLVSIWGLIEFFVAWKSETLNKRRLLMLGTMVLFGLLFEMKFLVYLGRLGLTPSVINMLPTYVLFFYLISLRVRLKPVALVIGMGMLLAYFVYPFGRYYSYFAMHAVPVEVPFSSGIKVSPYKRDLYQKVQQYVSLNTKPEDLIVVAEINRFYSVMSKRKDLYQNNFQTFLQASFYPSRSVTGLLDQSYAIEDGIVDNIKKNDVKLILIPELFRTGGDAQKSPFLKYLETHWQKAVVYGDMSLKNPFDWESPMEIYLPKQPDGS